MPTKPLWSTTTYKIHRQQKPRLFSPVHSCFPALYAFRDLVAYQSRTLIRQYYNNITCLFRTLKLSGGGAE